MNKNQRLMVRSLIVMIASAVLLLTACGNSTSSTTSVNASPSPSVVAAPLGSIKVTLVDYHIDPATINLPGGHGILYVKNDGKAPHNFTVTGTDGQVLVATPNLNPGQAKILVVHYPIGTTYKFLCTEPGHASLGMAGTITASS